MAILRRVKPGQAAPAVVKTVNPPPRKARPRVSGKPFALSSPIIVSDENRTNYKEVVERYQAKVKNPKSAIRAKCVECSGGSLKEVQLCPVKTCALHPFRLGQNPFHKKTKARLAAEGGVDNDEDDDEDEDEGAEELAGE